MSVNMAKEWILNSAMNRFQLNFKRNVGATSEEIRKCSPKDVVDWKNYYFSNVRSKEHIENSGRKLYTKINEVLSVEIESITEEDCIEYMYEVIINRTFRGYMAEIGAIYEDLVLILEHEIQPAPDEWDRKFNVDFFIQIKDKFIGLQIKSVRDENIGQISQIPQLFKEQSIQYNSHKDFSEKYGGNVFFIYSTKKGDKYQILNRDVIEEIKTEIRRLES